MKEKYQELFSYLHYNSLSYFELMSFTPSAFQLYSLFLKKILTKNQTQLLTVPKRKLLEEVLFEGFYFDLFHMTYHMK